MTDCVFLQGRNDFDAILDGDKMHKEDFLKTNI